MPQDLTKARGRSQSSADTPTIDVQSQATQEQTEPLIGTSVLSAQMQQMIQQDQSSLTQVRTQLMTYGQKRTEAVLGLFKNVIDDSNAAIDDGIRSINRGLSSDFLTETGIFFQSFQSLQMNPLESQPALISAQTIDVQTIPAEVIG
jgi:hypothetical protein